jgi:hypothetical protein
MGQRILFAMLCVLTFLGTTRAETPLPLVEEIDWPTLRDQGRALLDVRTLLPAETARALRMLLDRKPERPEDAGRAVQELLDTHCLLGVNINPESRVKATRGAARAEVIFNREALFLIKVHNEGGVTHGLAVSGPGLTGNDPDEKGNWLKATLATEAPFGKRLTGQRLEYRVLRLTAWEAGKREASFRFDVGQGTQDLGFRAEVPILFSVSRP